MRLERFRNDLFFCRVGWFSFPAAPAGLGHSISRWDPFTYKLNARLLKLRLFHNCIPLSQLQQPFNFRPALHPPPPPTLLCCLTFGCVAELFIKINLANNNDGNVHYNSLTPFD